MEVTVRLVHNLCTSPNIASFLLEWPGNGYQVNPSGMIVPVTQAACQFPSAYERVLSE